MFVGMRFCWYFLATIAMALSAAAGQDYYKVLGVTKSSSAADIKRAYRKLRYGTHHLSFLPIIHPLTNPIDA